jgi:inhibitor of cysteine peptidase
MQNNLVFTIAISAALAVLTGCPSPKAREFTASDNGRTVTLPTGTHFTVRLASNITTGYSWQLDALDQAVVLNSGNNYIGPAAPMPGAGGYEDWDFVTQAAGTTTLHMAYRRPWEQGSPPADTFALTITVTAGS